MPGPWEHLPDPVKPPRLRGAVRAGLWLWLAALAGLVLMLFVLDRLFPNSLARADTASLVQGVGWFALVSSGLLFVRQVNLRHAARTALIWVGVAGLLLLGYAYRDLLTDAALRLRGQLVPGYPVASGAGELTVSEDNSGGYQVLGRVNGASNAGEMTTARAVMRRSETTHAARMAARTSARSDGFWRASRAKVQVTVVDVAMPPAMPPNNSPLCWPPIRTAA